MGPRQFDVFANPIGRARRIFPYILLLQSDFAETGTGRVVAPLTPHRLMPPYVPRLMPRVRIGEEDYAVVVPALTVIGASGLRNPVAHLGEHRDEFTAALDFLFTGF